MGFSDADYALIDEGCRRSAETLAPLLARRLGLRPMQELLDVGCGRGHWVRAFNQLGLEASGVDAPDVDLAQEGALDGPPVDVLICLEVAEHLPSERAESFIEELCKLSPLIVFSAAIPGQGGIGHLNERWPTYWAKLFWDNDFNVSGAFRYSIWELDRIENWYRQNLLIVWRDEEARPAFELPEFPPLPLVHPVLYNARRQ